MDLSVIKKAPRWAWVTAGGIGIGAAGIKLWKNRAKPASETTATATDGSLLDANGNPLPTTSMANPVATIVPPVIIGGTGDGTGDALGNLMGIFTNLTQTIGDTYQSIWGPTQTAEMALLGNFGDIASSNAGAIQALAQAGSAPNSNTALPPELLQGAAPVIAAPVALPIAAPAPAPVAAAPVIDKCPGPTYPFLNPANGLCYTVACASGTGTRRKGRWHLYANSANDQWMGPTC